MTKDSQDAKLFRLQEQWNQNNTMTFNRHLKAPPTVVLLVAFK